MTRPRQTVGALSLPMRGSLLTGCAEILTARALSDRGLVAIGSGFRLRRTPLGKQIGAMLLDLHQMRVALIDIAHVLKRDAEEQPAGQPRRARDLALQSLGLSRRWVP